MYDQGRIQNKREQTHTWVNVRIMETKWQKSKSNTEQHNYTEKQCRATPMKPNDTLKQSKSDRKIENKSQHTILSTTC